MLLHSKVHLNSLLVAADTAYECKEVASMCWKESGSGLLLELKGLRWTGEPRCCKRGSCYST
jgi:hypothetical protein